MKKALRFIMEVNDASFAWYSAAAALLGSMNWAYPALMRESGIKLRTIAWFIGISTALKICSRVARKKGGDGGMRITIARLKPSAVSITGSIVILWALFAYQANTEIYRTLSGSGVAMPYAAALFFIVYWLIIASVIQGMDSKNETGVPDEEIKEIYRKRTERQNDVRLSKEFPLRKYAHETEYRSIAQFICAGEKVLDAGCGDGTLAIMLAQKGARVTACDISPINIAAGKKQAEKKGLEAYVEFMTADAESLPFADNSFDWVISSHVLEHVPDFEKALAEIRRVTTKKAIIAMPTCLNPCAAIVLGGDAFWDISRWSLTAWFVGCIRIILNLGGEGVNEGYSGDSRLPHIWRYPWVMRRKLKNGGFRIVSFQASSLCLPYFKRLIPLIRKLERFNASPVIKNFGYGSIAVVEK